jgi:hypothetical protein
LIGDQIVGDSSVEGYIRALQNGCKCVELDCWDGPNGDPIIYHGRTLTSKILFRDVIKTIFKYAFVVSDFPLILSLETHCSTEQQIVMGQILVEILGDSLVKEPLDGVPQFQLPSPQQLLKRIIVKGKITREEEFARNSAVSTSTEFEISNLASSSMPEMPRLSVANSTKSFISADLETDINTTKKIKKTTPTNLAELFVYIQGVSSKGIDILQSIVNSGSDPLEYNQIYSFTNRKSLNFIQKQLEYYQQMTEKHLIRVYPSAMRVTSSNYDPVPHWMAGVQLVALNFQTNGILVFNRLSNAT